MTHHHDGCSEQRNTGAEGPSILPLLPIRTKGRPGKKRLASAIENKGRGSGKRIKLDDQGGDGPGRRKCGKCGGRGHYATTCDRRK